MREFSSTYYLKPDTKIVDIYNCIRRLFELPKNPPKKYSMETSDTIIIWNCPEGNNGIVEFNYCYTSNEDKNELKIIFHKEIKDSLHALFYKEITSSSNFKYLDTILSPLKTYIPKRYIQTDFHSDKIPIQKIFRDNFQKIKINNSLDDVETYEIIENTVNRFLEIIVDPEHYSSEIACEIVKDEFGNEKPVIKKVKSGVAIAIDKAKKTISKHKIRIEFVPDTEGNYILSQKEMDQLLSELWYINADFFRSEGVLAILNLETFTNNIPKWRFDEKKTQSNEIAKKNYLEFRENRIAQKKEYVNTVLLLEAPAIKISTEESYYEIKKIEKIMDTFSEIKKEVHEYSYDEIKNRIIDYISDINSENENKTLSDLLNNKDDEDKIIEAKVALYLKEHGLEAEHFMELSKENNELNRILSHLKLQIEQKENIIKKLNLELASKQAEKNPIQNTDNSNLKQEIEELKTENGELKQIISNKESTIQLLKSSEDNKNNNDSYSLIIPCPEKELFRDEITDYLYNTLYNTIASDKEKLPHNKQTEVTRKRDIVEALLNNKNFDFSNSKTKNKLDRIESILKSSTKHNLEELQHEGFMEVDNTKNHPKVYFYDKRYQMTFASTPSDERGCLNKMQEIKERFFL